VNHHHKLSHELAWTAQNYNDHAPDDVRDFNKLREILSKSGTRDIYCRSALYFAFTGRGKVWTVRHGDSYLVLVPHPNLFGILLVFFPFVSDVIDLAEQVQALCNCRSFLKKFQEIYLARIPDSVAAEIAKKALGHNSLNCELEVINEARLDWAHPSYDVCLKSLANLGGGKLLAKYRNKVRKFRDQGKEIIGARILDQQELRKAISQISASWIQTKLNSNNSPRDFGIAIDDLIDPYQALAELSSDLTLEIDGLILKRGGAYIAFSLWETPRNGDIVPCMAAVPRSHEKGLSEYLYYCIAWRLWNDGHDSMCIGGSETVGLDQFKRKLNPIDIHKLRTIRLSPGDQRKNPVSVVHAEPLINPNGTVRTNKVARRTFRAAMRADKRAAGDPQR
jgi:hypothetical protein